MHVVKEKGVEFLNHAYRKNTKEHVIGVEKKFLHAIFFCQGVVIMTTSHYMDCSLFLTFIFGPDAGN